MRRINIVGAAILLISQLLPAVQCPLSGSLVPAPKECRVVGESKVNLDPNAVIVIGDKAADPEIYAAEQLQKAIKSRFGKTLAISREDKMGNATQRIVLGQPETNKYLKSLCKKNKIKLDAKTPGFDGYVIEVIKGDTVIIGGSNARGVTYGQSVFFDLLKKSDDAITFPAVSIRDWPSILWRGRPTSQLDLHDPISLDVCVHARINWIDIRDVNSPNREATFGYLAGEPIEKKAAKIVLDDAHSGGIFVYGTVSCGVTPDKFDAVIKTCEELVALGVDGLWISYDDPGPGKYPDVLVRRVIDLGKKHNMTDHAIAITPPSGSYQEIDAPWNRLVAQKGGASKAAWFFTRIPCARDITAAREVGITSLPAWWHNWPRPAGGLLSEMAGGRSLYKNKWAWAYYELMPLSAGWDKPSYEQLRHADKYTDNVMLWQTCPPEYVCHVLGYWAWDPNAHDWDKVEKATYSYVFGNDQAAIAKTFDEKLAKLKTLFTVPKYKDTSPNVWPPRLRKLEDRAQAMELLDGMEAVLNLLEKQSPLQSILDGQRLQEMYLTPMRDNIAYGRIMVKLEYPEYTLPNFADEMTALVETNEPAAAKRIEDVRPTVTKQIGEISTQLSGLKRTSDYIKQWNDYVSGTAFWKEQAAQQKAQKAKAKQMRAQVAARFDEMVKGNYDELLKKQSSPPDGRVVLEISPEKWLGGTHRIKGEWAIGLYRSPDYNAMAVGMTGDRDCNEGDAVEASAAFVVPQYKGRLELQIFIAQRVLNAGINQRQDVRSSWLRIDRKTLWHQDVAASFNGWVTLDITDIALPGETLSLRFRVDNKIRVKGYETISFVGPARFVEK